MTYYKTGIFVQFEGCLCSITAITKGIAMLSNGQEVACDLLCPEKIGIIKTEPIKNYQDCCFLQGKSIKVVLKENPSIKNRHKLQNWLLKNEDGFHLVNTYGQY